jgi:hypothetical protein
MAVKLLVMASVAYYAFELFKADIGMECLKKFF